MSFLYIFGTVISGYPLISGIAYVSGLDSNSNLTYLTRLFDAMIYFFLPQINVLVLRIIQRRPLRHRMVGRTVVIGDIPWVAQAAEAFLSKIFACSYSIAGINVHSANPSDHLVHRMTHRVVRGSLLICGRPDGRLTALTAAENAVSLSINQASSIQSIGSTCETVTIGHNEFKLPLSARAIFLDRHRPLFLCEYLLAEKSGDNVKPQDSLSMSVSLSRHSLSHSLALSHHSTLSVKSSYRPRQSGVLVESNEDDILLQSIKGYKPRPKSKKHFGLTKGRSSSALLGEYKTIEREHSIRSLNEYSVRSANSQFNPNESTLSVRSTNGQSVHSEDNFPTTSDNLDKHSLRNTIKKAIQEKKWQTQAHRLFEELNVDNDAKLKHDEFTNGMRAFGCEIPENELSKLFLRL